MYINIIYRQIYLRQMPTPIWNGQEYIMKRKIMFRY